ncbi:hypothetical protein LV89_02358 [Arcicella aurantiaca]|uniref:O-antigen ligase-like membrane protein n=1 Tax=Arcicella aurantiaca TaxID=591202 RepID=A0A316ECM0_9BACT|nr:hypothetical protein [Arcicella aurantiaca]PWK26513.1 hypothetical protein LV89_02358 [Arcicella aurantiaca]
MNSFFNFKYSRQFLGIFMVFMGSPLIFFFKEIAGFGGASTFTIGSLVLGMILMISPDDIFKKFYKPNLPLFRLASVFIAIALINFFFANPFYGYSANRYVFIRDLGNYMFIFTFFFLLLGVSNDIKDYFLPIVVGLTFLGSVCLIYSMATNPYFVIGQRASVVFGDGSTTASGNPHVYARNAFGGVFASYLMLKNKSMIWKIFSLANLVLSIIVLVLTQARSILLAFFFTIAIFCYYNISRQSVKNVFLGIFKPQNFFLILLLFAGFSYFVSTQAKLVSIITMYYDAVTITFTKAILTATGMAEDTKSIDYSAMGRVNSFAEFKKVFFETPWQLILGKGYRFLYMDIPLLETWIDCGIMAFISFSLMNFVIFIEALRAIKEGRNPLTTFLGYFYMCYFVGLFTGGEPYGTPYWFIFCVMIRFLGIKYIQRNINFLKKSVPKTSPVM